MMTDNIFHENGEFSTSSAIVIHPDLSGIPSLNKASKRRDIESMVGEICGLVEAIHLEVCAVEVFKLSSIQAGAFLGKGQREKIATLVEELAPEIVVINHALSPVQQRNLEKAFNAKVIDRTGLILEIFGERAQTKEGRLQVDLAALEYQRSRLVRSWTHLERQRGGAGFMGGPGERQIELDRRIIGNKIINLKKELESVKRTRELGRKARAKIPFPVVALVGYTNAGKSTLFNRLTHSKVFAEDLLFATLDPTLRKLNLPNGQTVILSDTVGFISDLPTHLIAAFRATLEETLHADVILHVCDVASDDFKAQHDDVKDILESLGIEYEADERVLEVYNKIDAADKDRLGDLARYGKRIVAVSALNGQGTDYLLERISTLISAHYQDADFDLPYADGKALSWLYEHGDVLERQDLDQGLHIKVRMSVEDLARFIDKYPYHPA